MWEALKNKMGLVRGWWERCTEVCLISRSFAYQKFHNIVRFLRQFRGSSPPCIWKILGRLPFHSLRFMGQFHQINGQQYLRRDKDRDRQTKREREEKAGSWLIKTPFWLPTRPSGDRDAQLAHQVCSLLNFTGMLVGIFTSHLIFFTWRRWPPQPCHKWQSLLIFPDFPTTNLLSFITKFEASSTSCLDSPWNHIFIFSVTKALVANCFLGHIFSPVTLSWLYCNLE